MTKVIDGSPCFGGLVKTIDYKVPCPSISAFGYTADMGVMRTSVATGHARQRRIYQDRPTAYNLTWILTTGQLHAWEAFAQQYGYHWFFLPMVTGQVPAWFSVEHPVRFTDDFQVNLVQKDLWEVSVNAEQYKFDDECMLDLVCDQIRECLQHPVANPALPSWAPFVNSWGSSTFWGMPND